MKVWAEYVFGTCPTFILDEINKRHYDLYLLCKPDIPWVKDALREYPDEKPRQELFQMYKDILINQQTPWIEISGGFEARNQKAVAAIDAVLAR
jgi:nicotinamide riboside kinase